MNTYKTIAALEKVIKLAAADMNEADADADVEGFLAASSVFNLANKALQSAQTYAIVSAGEAEMEGALP